LAAVVLCSGVFASPMLVTAETSPAPALTGFSSLAKLMGRHVSDPGFRLGSLEIDVTFDPSKRLMLVDYSADLDLVGDALRDVENWTFWPAEGVTEVTLGGIPVPVSQGLQVPEFKTAHALNLAFSEAATLVARGSPARLVIRTKGEIPAELEVERYGIVQDIQQTINELCALCASGSDWTLTITVPVGWSAISIGKRVNVVSQGSGDTASFAWAVPVSKWGANFMIIAGPYSRVALDLPGDIGLWLLQEDMASKDELAAAVAGVIKRANQVMSGDVGMPAVEELEIVKASALGQGRSGKGPYGLVLVEYGRGKPFSQDLFLQTLSHEVVHQWFPGRAELDFATGLWLSEGIATYFDVRYLHDEWPLDKYLGQNEFRPSPHSIYDVSSRIATMSGSVKMQVLYIKGAWVASALRATVGEEAFHRTLQRFYLSQSKDLRGTPQFHAIAEQESGLDLTHFFQQWLGAATTPRVSLENVTLARVPDGWRVGGTVINRSPMPLPPVIVSVISDGDPVEVIEVLLPDVTGQDPQQAVFEITAPSLFAEVVLDPNSDFLNLAESGRRVSLVWVWARQPWVTWTSGIVLAGILGLILRGLSRYYRSARLRRQSANEQPADGSKESLR